MRLITYAAALPPKYGITLEQWLKIQEEIKRVVRANLLEIVGSGISFEEANFPEEVGAIIREELRSFVDEE